MHGCDCPHCGRFVFDLFLAEKLNGAGDDAAFRIACLLRERALRKEKGVFGLFSEKTEPQENTIHKHLAKWWQVDELLAEFPKATDLIDRVLLNLETLQEHPLDTIKLQHADAEYFCFSPRGNAQELLYCMQEMGLIRRLSLTSSNVLFILAPGGWQRIADLKKGASKSRQAFVAIWFDATMNDFEKAIENAIQDEGFECRIIKNIEHNNDICDEIVAEIRKSRFIVADFTAGCCKKCETCEEHKTCRDTVRQRGGVYFEAGFALGLGIPVIWTVRKDQIEHIHFDTRQYSYIVYENAEELRQKLRNRIAATIH